MIDLILTVAQARAGPQGRSWPLGGAVRAGVVPTWSDVLGAELGHVPPCLDSRSAACVWSCLCSAAALACIACTYLAHLELESKQKTVLTIHQRNACLCECLSCKCCCGSCAGTTPTLPM